MRIKQFLPFTSKSKKPIAWLVHPRDEADVCRQVPLLKYIPATVTRRVVLWLPPYIVSSFTVQNANDGYIIAVPLLPVHFRENPEKSKRKLEKAFLLAKEHGAHTVSVGGFLSSFSKKVILPEGVRVIDGTELLPRLVMKYVEEALTRSLDKTNKLPILGIIGATTETGKVVSKLSSQLSTKKIHLFGKTEKNLHALQKECETKKNTETTITYSDSFEGIEDCDILLVTAFLPADVSIDTRFKKGATLINAIEPPSPFITALDSNRSDMEVMKGITVYTPDVSYGNFHFGLPEKHSFVCLTEAVMYTREGKDNLFKEKEAYSAMKEAQVMFRKYNYTENI